jgi:hypothetical protein
MVLSKRGLQCFELAAEGFEIEADRRAECGHKRPLTADPDVL